MISSFNDFASAEAGSASTFAQSIGIGPMTLGGPALIVGLIFLLLVGGGEGKHLDGRLDDDSRASCDLEKFVVCPFLFRPVLVFLSGSHG